MSDNRRGAPDSHQSRAITYSLVQLRRVTSERIMNRRGNAQEGPGQFTSTLIR